METQSTTAIEMVYYSATGSYWHLSEECAEEDYVHVVYNMQGETMPAPKPRITKSPKTMIVRAEKRPARIVRQGNEVEKWL